VTSIEPTALSSANTNVVATNESGARAVLRCYREKPEPHTALARLRRERWALGTLGRAGAPVPRVLASTEEVGAEALLMEFADGELLGAVVARSAPEDATAAWLAAGSALAKVHAIDNILAAAAGCEEVGIRAPEASRGLYHYEEALAHLGRLSRSRPDLPPLRPLQEIVAEALPLYEQAPIVLCQYDVHLWQFVLRRASGGWTCTAILDWEHADLDDPDWDLAQLDVFRFEEVTETPPAFFTGYGREPRTPLYRLYRGERAAWTLDAYALGQDWLALSARPAERYLRSLLNEPERLRTDVRRAVEALG
jgi:aminoglycoside phosphotransferase (APT) family kinase protein